MPLSVVKQLAWNVRHLLDHNNKFNELILEDNNYVYRCFMQNIFLSLLYYKSTDFNGNFYLNFTCEVIFYMSLLLIESLKIIS